MMDALIDLFTGPLAPVALLALGALVAGVVTKLLSTLIESAVRIGVALGILVAAGAGAYLAFAPPDERAEALDVAASAIDDLREQATGGASAAEAPASGALPATTILAWNVNAGVHSDRDQQLPFIIASLAGSDADILALSEVQPSWFGRLTAGASSGDRSYGGRLGEWGNTQRLAVLWDEARFDFVRADEMTGVVDGHGRGNRAPLAVVLRDRASGVEVEVVAIHLNRGDDARRTTQAARLNTGIRERSGDRLTVVIGDGNVDCPLETAPAGCNDAFHRLVADDVLTWIDPAERRETTCTTRYDDMLDVAFVDDAAVAAHASVDVLTGAAWCDRMDRGAHYPIRLSLGASGR